jgi:hypothetical protein
MSVHVMPACVHAQAAEEAGRKLDAAYASLSAAFEAQQAQLDVYAAEQAAAGMH